MYAYDRILYTAIVNCSQKKFQIEKLVSLRLRPAKLNLIHFCGRSSKYFNSGNILLSCNAMTELGYCILESKLTED